MVITGVSSGIGRAAAEHLLIRGYTVHGGVRSPQDARELTGKFPTTFHPLFFDVTDRQAVGEAAGSVRERLQGHHLTALVNSAGIAVAGPLLHIPEDQFHQQFEVNFFGVLRVTRAFFPLLMPLQGESGHAGRIINISSIGGRIALPFIGPYTASKHALEAFSHSLRRELMFYGVDVIIITPGNTDTPIWSKAEDVPVYEETDYARILPGLKKRILHEARRDMLPPERIARVIETAISKKKPRTHYLIMRHKLMGWILPRLLPDRWLDTIIAHRIFT